MRKFLSLIFAVFMTVMAFGQSYGILVNGTTYFAGTPKGLNFEGYDEFLAPVQLKAGDYCQLYDADNKAAWAVALNPYSVEGFTLNGDRYEVAVTGCYDFYIQLKYGEDRLYIGNGSECGEGVEIGGGEGGEEAFVGFDASTKALGEQIEAGLAKNQVNVNFVETSTGKYSINLVEGGVEGSFSFGGVVFAYKNSNAGSTAWKTYGTYIQPNGKDREVRIPLKAGEKANVILVEACTGVLVNGESVDFEAGDNILTASAAGLVLKSASTKPKIQAILPVEEPPVDPGENMTVHFVNKAGWEVVNAFVWPAEGDAYKVWPGEAMTKEAEKINDFDVFEYTFPALHVNIIFNNGKDQTDDLVWDAAKPYFYDGKWYAKEDIPAVEPPVDPGENITVHFVNQAGWEVVNAYVWPAEGDAYKVWPGEAMTKEEEKINDFDVYSYTFPAANINIIFNNGTNQTVNLVWDAAKLYFVINAAAASSESQFEGQWYAKEDIPAVEPEVPNGFYLVGTFNDWKPSAEYAFAPNPELAPGEEYMLTVDLQTGDELKGLVVLMGEWYYYPDGDNIVVTEEYAGNCTIYFRPLGNPEWPMKYIYIQRNHGQGIEETLSEGKAVKVLREGQLLIMKGNHSYTPMGQIVK